MTCDTKCPIYCVRSVSEFAQNGGGCVTALRRSACIFYKIDDIAKAHEFLSTALSKYPEFITPSGKFPQ